MAKQLNYFLFGKAESSTAKAYIGEAENAYARLVQHVAEKELWNEASVAAMKRSEIKGNEFAILDSASLHQGYGLVNRACNTF